MTIFLAILAALALVGWGTAIRRLRQRNTEYGWLQKDYDTALEVNQTLRANNRTAVETWQSERERLQARAESAERHAKELQDFHTVVELDLQHELDGAHALIELLMTFVPSGGDIARLHDVRRLFRLVGGARSKFNASEEDKNPGGFATLF